MKKRRNLAIKKAQRDYRKKYSTKTIISMIDLFNVKNMNLKNNTDTLLGRASLLTRWSENEKFQVQVELVRYKSNPTNWQVECFHPIGDIYVNTTAPKAERMKQQKHEEEYKEYRQFVKENKDSMIKFLLEECDETKNKLSIK